MRSGCSPRPGSATGTRRSAAASATDRGSCRQRNAEGHGTPGRCEIESGPSLAAQTARRLSCDASLVTIVEDESGQPLDVGRKTRSIPPAIRRALRSRDAGCRFPGCTHTRFLDGHHIRHWADGGETKLSNLVMLCRFHHRQVHEGRVDVRMLDDGALRFTGARGQRFERRTDNGWRRGPTRLPASDRGHRHRRKNCRHPLVRRADRLRPCGWWPDGSTGTGSPGRCRGNVGTHRR